MTGFGFASYALAGAIVLALNVTRPQHNSITETKWLIRPYFSLENLAIPQGTLSGASSIHLVACYYLHFPPQLRPSSLISLSSLSYAEIS
jgi:hypothetical protein